MSFRELEAAAPEIAAVAREHISSRRLALLGTIRPDGWPRISPIEPAFVDGDLVLGIIASPKVEDLRREPRCVLHNLVVGGSGSEPEVKLTGRAAPTEDGRILSAEGTWWAGRFEGRVALFRLEIGEAVVVTWDTGADRMRVRRWRRGERATESERAYP